MKVTPLPPLELGRLRPGPTAPPASNPPRPAAEVRAAFSPLYTRLQEANAALPPEGPFDQARVEEIRQALREGRLRMDPARIADDLIVHVQALAPYRG